jgi:hypothetical protein
MRKLPKMSELLSSVESFDWIPTGYQRKGDPRGRSIVLVTALGR